MTQPRWTINPRRAAAITALVCATPIISHSLGRSLYGLLLPAIRDDWGLSNAQAGLPGTGIFLSYVIGVVTVVFVSPRFEPITIMRVAVGLSVLGLFLAATAPGLALLALGVSLVGGAGAGIWMSAPVLATEYVSERRRGLVIGALTSTMGLSNISFGIGTTAWRSAADDQLLWRPIWWVAFGFTAVVLLLLIGIARFPKTDTIRTSGVDLSIIRQIPRWREVTLAYAVFGGMSAGFGTFIVAALQDHGGVSKSNSLLVFSLMGVAGMISAPACGALSDRLGRIAVLRLAAIVLLAANLAVAWGGQVPTIFGAIAYGAGAAAFPTLVAAYVRDSLDSRSFSQALAIMTVLFSVLAAILPFVVGWFGDRSFRWSYLVLAAMPVIAFVLLRDERDRNSP